MKFPESIGELERVNPNDIMLLHQLRHPLHVLRRHDDTICIHECRIENLTVTLTHRAYGSIMISRYKRYTECRVGLFNLIW